MQKNKLILLAPVMGGLISLFIFSSYLMATASYEENSFFKVFYSLVKILPMVMLSLTIISYIVCLIVGVPLIYIKNKYLLSPSLFWFLSLNVFFILGVAAGILNYQLDKNINKSLTIFLSVTFGGFFSSSLFSVLNGDIKDGKA